jgi:hypothetical protein
MQIVCKMKAAHSRPRSVTYFSSVLYWGGTSLTWGGTDAVSGAVIDWGATDLRTLPLPTGRICEALLVTAPPGTYDVWRGGQAWKGGSDWGPYNPADNRGRGHKADG